MSVNLTYYPKPVNRAKKCVSKRSPLGLLHQASEVSAGASNMCLYLVLGERFGFLLGCYDN